MQRFYVVASGIKSDKTRRRLEKALIYKGYLPGGDDSQVWAFVHSYTPASALEGVFLSLTSFTPDHLSNLTWTVTTVDPSVPVVPAPIRDNTLQRVIIMLGKGELVIVEVEPDEWVYESTGDEAEGESASEPRYNEDPRKLVLA